MEAIIMELVEKAKSDIEKQPEDEVLYQIFPDMKRRINYSQRVVEIEVALPGVGKDQIMLKVLPSWFNLTARRGQMQYAANSAFGAEVIPEKTQAKYDNGLLTIVAHIKNPLDSATEISL